jgi:hypothetical protein
VSGEIATPRRASVLTVGETMALLDPLEDGVPQLGTRLELRVGGADSNVAVALGAESACGGSSGSGAIRSAT